MNENKTIYERLSAIQKELKVGKKKNNTFGNYKFRNASDICIAIKDLLEPNEYITCNNKVIMVGDRYYIEATATFYKEDKSISIQAQARESLDKKGMDDSQITGSATSYARKYALAGLFMIDDEEDADNKENDKKEAKKTTPKPAPEINKYYQAIIDDKYELLNNGANIRFSIDGVVEDFKAKIGETKEATVSGTTYKYKQYGFWIDSCKAYLNLNGSVDELTKQSAVKSATKFLKK